MLTSEYKYQGIIDFYEHAPMLFSLYDENLCLLDANLATLRFLKKSGKEELRGKHIEEISPGISETGRLTIYENVVKTGHPVQLRSVVTTPSLGSRHVGVYAFKSGKGLAIIAVEVSEWIEEEKAMIALLERKNKELEQFAYVASHDLQEPLETVASFASLLERKYADKIDEKGKEYIHFINQAI